MLDLELRRHSEVVRGQEVMFFAQVQLEHDKPCVDVGKRNQNTFLQTPLHRGIDIPRAIGGGNNDHPITFVDEAVHLEGKVLLAPQHGMLLVVGSWRGGSLSALI